MSEPTVNSEYIPKVLVFIYHNGNIDDFTFAFNNKNGEADPNEYKKVIIHKKLTCFLVNYKKIEDHIISITASLKGEPNSEKYKYNLNSTIIEIQLPGYSQEEKGLFNDIVNYEDHESVKVLFKYATSKLQTHIAKQETPLMHYLFNIQPNGQILSQMELLDFAKDFIVWLPSLIEKMKNHIFFYSEYVYFIFRKLWHGQIFGATALITAMYHQKEVQALIKDEKFSTEVKKKIEKNTFSLPIDLEFSDLTFAEENLNLISQNIITCNEAYLAFLSGYQICLHSKFMEITKEWMVDVNSIEIEQFAEIFCNRVKATLMGRQFWAFENEKGPGKLQYTTYPKAVIQKFVEFSKIFLEKNQQIVKEALRKHIDEYITEELITSLDF